MPSLEEFTATAQTEIDAKKTVNGGPGMWMQFEDERREYTEEEYANAVVKQGKRKFNAQENGYKIARGLAYPSEKEFIEAYTEKEIGGDSTKWDAYVVNYNKARTDNPKG